MQSLNALQRFLLFQIFPYRWRNRVALAPARLMQWTGLDWLTEKIGLTEAAAAVAAEHEEHAPAT